MVMVPCASNIMGDFGAEVIKVEPAAGDMNRRGHFIPGMPTSDLEYCYYQDNRNKKSVVLDLKDPEGSAAFLKLIETSDVFFTNYRHSALDSLGLDYETLRQINPRLIYAHGTGFGDEGPEAANPGYDVVSYWSRSGLEAVIFPHEGFISSFGYATGDHPSGTSLFSAVMLALYQRQQTGQGCRVTTSLIANGAWSNSSLISARLAEAEFQERLPREQSRHYSSVYYRSGDDRIFKVAIVDHPKSWPGFARAIGKPELAESAHHLDIDNVPGFAPEIIRHCDALFAQHDLTHWKGVFRENDIPFSVMADFDDVAADPQMKANDVFLEIDDPRHGKVRSVNSPITLDGTPKVTPQPAPALGEHTAEVLRDLGLGDEVVARLTE